MAKNEIMQKISGYDEIVAEKTLFLKNTVLTIRRKRGEVRSIIDALHPQRLDLTVSEISPGNCKRKIH